MDQSAYHMVATNRNKWIAFIVLSGLLILLALFWEEETLLLAHRIVMISACVLLLLYAFCNVIYSVTITNNGVSCSCLGKARQCYQWDQIDEIVIVRDYRISFSISGNTRIVVTPKGCPTYSKKKWSGVQYVILFGKQVIWMDDTTANRKLIANLFGKIIDCR